MSKKNKPVLVLTSRDGREVKLLEGAGKCLREQIIRNGEVRARLGNQTFCPLFVLCEVDGMEMMLESKAIVVRFFAPRTEAEKFAIRESEFTIYLAKKNEHEHKDTSFNYAYAEEMLFLAVCGMEDYTFIPKPAKPLPVKGLKLHHVGEIQSATWNESESQFGLPPFEEW